MPAAQREEQGVRAVEIVAGTDDSVAGRHALDWAAQRARLLGLRLNLVRVVPGPWAYRRPSGYRDAMQHAHVLLQAEASRLSGLDPHLVIVTTRRTGETPAVLKLLSDAAETVVVGSDRAPDSHGEGFGAISFETAVSCRCPVAVIPAAGPGENLENAVVVVGVDGSDDSEIALQFAGAEAVRAGRALMIVHAVPPPGSAALPLQPVSGGHESVGDGHVLLSSAADEVRELYPDLEVRRVLETADSPAGALIRNAAHAALLVIGCRGGGSVRKPVGVVAAKVLEHLPCPTIVTRPTAPV